MILFLLVCCELQSLGKVQTGCTHYQQCQDTTNNITSVSSESVSRSHIITCDTCTRVHPNVRFSVYTYDGRRSSISCQPQLCPRVKPDARVSSSKGYDFQIFVQSREYTQSCSQSMGIHSHTCTYVHYHLTTKMLAFIFPCSTYHWMPLLYVNYHSFGKLGTMERVLLQER